MWLAQKKLMHRNTIFAIMTNFVITQKDLGEFISLKQAWSAFISIFTPYNKEP